MSWYSWVRSIVHGAVVAHTHDLVCVVRYVAPEIITKQRYGPAVDVWSLGVIFYILLCGYPPFLADTRAALFRCIMKGRFEFHDDAWGQVSDEAKDFISQMLVVDPQKRATPKQLLEHKCVDMRGCGI